jgi:hypothetical protein
VTSGAKQRLLGLGDDAPDKVAGWHDVAYEPGRLTGPQKELARVGGPLGVLHCPRHLLALGA